MADIIDTKLVKTQRRGRSRESGVDITQCMVQLENLKKPKNKSNKRICDSHESINKANTSDKDSVPKQTEKSDEPFHGFSENMTFPSLDAALALDEVIDFNDNSNMNKNEETRSVIQEPVAKKLRIEYQ